MHLIAKLPKSLLKNRSQQGSEKNTEKKNKNEAEREREGFYILNEPFIIILLLSFNLGELFCFGNTLTFI